jgi:hypothetical protein
MLTIPTTSASFKQSFYSLKDVHAYLCSMQSKETFIKLSLTTSKNIIQGVENSLNSVILWQMFSFKKLLSHGTEVWGVIKKGHRFSQFTFPSSSIL